MVRVDTTAEGVFPADTADYFADRREFFCVICVQISDICGKN